MCELEESYMVGYPNNLSLHQRQIYDDFVIKMNDWKVANPKAASVENSRGACDEDRLKIIYLKFLRARQFDLDQAFKLYSNFLTWKHDFQGIGVNNIKVNSVMNEIKTGKCFSYGYCRGGRPIIWIKFHLHKKSQSDPQEAERFIAWFFESAKYLPREEPIETTTVVIDLSNIGRENMDMTVARHWMDMLGSRYPECLGKGLLLNAPWIFSAFWNVLKPFIDPRTFKKLQWVNSSDLSKHIDEDNILKEYGGKGEYVLERDPIYSQHVALSSPKPSGDM